VNEAWGSPGERVARLVDEDQAAIVRAPAGRSGVFVAFVRETQPRARMSQNSRGWTRVEAKIAEGQGIR
jgi:hypothetical protein